MEKIVHRAASRGFFDHGWLKTHHTFSFAGYYDEQRIRFGALRVLNDDTVGPGEGFGPHPHSNMEIVSIPLEGALEHGDSMGHKGIIRPGQIQVMSAGTGVIHSEYNGSDTELVKFLQIWVLTQRENVRPRYKDITLAPAKKNELQLIVGPEAEAGEHVGWIYQQAWFYLATLEKDKSVAHDFHTDNDGVYLFVLEGSVSAAGEELQRRDGMGVWKTESLDIQAVEDSQILLIEVPVF